MSSDADVLAAERRENEILHAQIAAFQEGDRDAELEKQIRFGIEQKNDGNMNKVGQLDKELRQLRKQFAQLCKIMKVDTNANVVSTVKTWMNKISCKTQ